MKYYIYRLDAKRNKFGNPYYGMTDNLKRRTGKWRRVLKDPSIELVVIEEHDDEDYCWEREQDVYRVPNGWPRERDNRKKQRERSIKGGETQQTEEARKITSERQSTPEMKKLFSTKSKELWQNAEFRNKILTFYSTSESKEKKSKVATIVMSNNRIRESIRLALCNFYKITICNGSSFIANGTNEALRILNNLGYKVSGMTIQNYAKFNENEIIPIAYIGSNNKGSKHPKGSINIIIVPSTLEEYKRYQNDYGAHSDTVSSGE